MKHLVLLILSLALFAGCVETSLIYNPNTYQSGKTSGRHKTKLKTSVTLAPTIRSADSTDNENVRDNIMIDWSRVDPAVEYVIGVTHGLSDLVDLGGTLGIGFGGAPLFSLRPFGKFMLTKPESRFAFSVMPALNFIVGSTDKQSATNVVAAEQIRSHAEVIELHLPMSVKTGAHSAFTWTPHLLRLAYTADYKHDLYHSTASYDIQTKQEKTGVGLSVGWIWRGVHPEASIIGFDGENPLFAVGLGAHP